MIQNVGPQFTQWDTGRSVSVSNTDATHIHFANQGDSKAVIIEINEGLAKVPDYLFQTGKTLLAYAVKDGVTLEGKSFAVRKRERPENYVYEDDQRNYIYELITSAENAVEDANLAVQNANDAADKAKKAAESWVLIGEARGDSISINDAIDQSFAGFRIFGKTTQDGVPTPEAPVDLVSVENPTVAVNEQSMLVPYTLHGIPVTTGGNYTDANGQQWVCDEVDFARGVYVQRVGKITTEDFRNAAFSENNSSGNFAQYIVYDALKTPAADIASTSYPRRAYCNIFPLGAQVTSGTEQESFWIYSNTYVLFVLNKNAHPDAKSAKEYILSHDMVIYYILNDQIETLLSPEELAAYASLHTTRGNNTVSNDAGAWMDLAYAMDAKKYIDSKIASAILPATVE